MRGGARYRRLLSTPAREAARFQAALTHTVADISPAPTFSRTDSGTNNICAMVVDCYGAYQPCRTGELRFFGARRVENICTKPEDLSDASWVKGSVGSVTYLSAETGPQGRANVWRVDRASGTENLLALSSRSYRPGQHTWSLWLSGDGSAQYTILIQRSTDDVIISTQTVTPSAAFQRCYVSGVIASTANHRVVLRAVASGAASVKVAAPQMERTVGQTGVPNDYVPRGLTGATSPFQGAYVDGVKYFATENPWSGASGIATEGVGAPLTTLKGVLTERTVVNRLYSSAALEATEWTRTNVTVAALTTDTNLGYGFYRRVTETTATGVHTVDQSWRLTLPSDNVVVTNSALFPQSQTGGRTWVYCEIVGKDGSTVTRQYFDLANGVLGQMDGGTNAVGVIYEEAGGWVCGLSCNVGSGSTAPVARWGIATADGTRSYTGSTSNYVDMAMPQFERADHPTSRVTESPSASVNTRGSDVLTLNLGAGSFRPNDWCVSVEVTPVFVTSITNKETWYYAWYHYTSADERFGMSWRPGTFGGAAADARADDVNGDIYETPGPENWDGVHLDSGYEQRPYETSLYQYGALPTAQTGASNLVGSVDGVVMTQSGSPSVARINTLAWDPTFVTIGCERVADPPRQSQCTKNFKIFRGRTASQQQVAAD